MFTGIITGLGRIVDARNAATGKILTVQTPAGYLDDVQHGDSIAINGACMTVTQFDAATARFTLDISAESLDKTAGLGEPGPVNLEKALRAHDRLGGHLVSGHVDGIGQVVEKKNDGRSVRFKFKAPDNLAKYIAEKGSICIDGISLTVNSVDGAFFAVNIVPHTLQETTLGQTEVGQDVNLEVDLLARYLERLMQGEAAADCKGGITEALLVNAGFIK